MRRTDGNPLRDRVAALSREQRTELLKRLVQAGRSVASLPIPPRPDPGAPVPFSPAQSDLWAFEALYPGTAALNLCGMYHFDRPVDPDDLEAAMTAVVAHHEALRTRLHPPRVPDSPPLMTFPPVDRFSLERIDLRGTGIPLAHAVTAFRYRPFDLERDQLIRAQYVVVGYTRSALLLGLHHIITDWWSFDILHTDLAIAYRAVRRGKKPELPPAPVQYGDVASWQRELEAGGVLDAKLAFWRDYLNNPPSALAVGTVGGEGSRFDNVRVPVTMSPELAAEVRAFARRRGTSVYAVLISAFAVLAHRLSGAPDLVLGTPMANRSAQGLARVVGYVMNAVPTRWRISADDSFDDILDGFTATFPKVLEHADVPVGRIVSAVAPPRTAGRSPLFQWVFMHLPDQESIHDLPESARFERIHTGGEHDLVVALRDTEDAMSGSFEVRTERYSPALVSSWADHYLTLVAGLVSAPHRPVAEIDLLTEEERARKLAAGDGSVTGRPAVSLAGLVAEQADRTPDAPALECDDLVLSYAQLAGRAGALARRLEGLSVGPERTVAVACGSPFNTVLAVLAVSAAGGVFMPLDTTHPDERLRLLVGDAAPVLLVTDHRAAMHLPDTDVPVYLLDDAVPDAEHGLPRRVVRPDQAAYVIHTSGSTGRPKGVVVTHGGIADLAATLTGRFGLTGDDRVLQASSPGFDAIILELCAAFGAGATLVVPQAAPLVGAALSTALRDQAITCLTVTPSVLATVEPGDHPALPVLCVVGEACPPELLAAWAPGRRMFNGYGPTETTVVVTVSDPLVAGARPPLGRVVAGDRLYLLDERLHPVPDGVTGELYAAGAGVARGYLERAGATAERFVADPYAPEPGARMYRTGDLAHRRHDGELEYVGRSDGQVKVNGVRIEPGEIETTLAEHPSVARAAVLVREDRPGERRLTAYLVPRPGSAVDVDLVRDHAAQRLPTHSVPPSFVTLDGLPVTPGGKLDRAALPAPAADLAGGRREPTDDRERLLCSLVADVLGRDGVGPDDGFFDLGGDSIMAIQLVGRARRAGLHITARDVLTASTPARLAARAARTGRLADTAPGDDDTGRLPLTPIMRWWLENGGCADTFTQSVIFTIPAGIGRAHVVTVLETLLQQNGALRMRLLPDMTELEVLPADAVSADACLSYEDVRGQEPDRVLDAARAAAVEVDAAPWAGGLLRATWYDAGDSPSGLLLLTVHHLGVDGLSWRLLGEEVASLLAGNAPAQKQPGGTSFRRWAQAVHEEARRPERLAELPFWQRTLADQPGLPPVAASAGPEPVALTTELPEDLTDRVLTRLPAAASCGPDAVMLTALTAAVLRWRGGGTAVLTDVEGHGRQEPSGDIDVSRTVGWFTSQYPLRLDLTGLAGGPGAFWSGRSAPRQALKLVADHIRAVPNRGFGYGLLRYLNPDTERLLAPLAIPQLRFNYVGRFAAGSPDAPHMLGSAPDPAMTAHRLAVDVVAEERPYGTRLAATWIWPSGGYSDSTVRELAELWREALTLLAAEPAAGEWS